MNTKLNIKKLLKSKNQGVKIDLGGGANPQRGFINIDSRDLSQVDIIHNLEKFPWPLPDECASMVMASHLLEHINPMAGDARISPLIQLLLDKKLIKKTEVEKYIGEKDSGPLFIRLMNEVWRILKPGAQFMMALPYGGSPGYWQDPTHCNGCNEVTWAYFDPLEAGGYLYKIY